MNNALREIPLREPLSHHSLSVLRTLLYFDIFNYPLTLPEIMNFSGSHIPSGKSCALEIERLLEDGLIYKFDEFHSLHNDRQMIERRLKGNQEAAKCIPLA